MSGRTLFVTVALLVTTQVASGQQAVLSGVEPSSPTLGRLLTDIERSGAPALTAFWEGAAVNGTPLVEPDTMHPGHVFATFLFRAPDAATEVEFQSAILSLDQEAAATSRIRRPMEQLGDSDVRYITVRLRNDVRAPYHFRVRTPGTEPEVVTDPLNPSVWEAEQSALRASILELAGAPRQPWRNAGAEAGDWDEPSLNDAAGEARTVYVYKPAGWRANGGQYPALVGIGAFGTGIGMRVDWMADHLIATGRLAPMVFLLVDVMQQDEATRYESLESFIVNTVLPYAREHYGVSREPTDIAVSGTSRRGMIASLVALRRPDVVQRVISLSGSYYWKPVDEPQYVWLPARYAGEGRKPIRFYVAAGELETFVNPGNRGHYLVGTNRHFRDVLRARGYEHTYVEFNGVHSELNWQDWLAAGLTHFFGGSH